MKRFVAALFICLIASVVAADVSVRGYVRKDGTYVQPHMRSNPDGNFYNNWSTKGNVNPYTGQPGTKVTPPPNYGGSRYGRSAQLGPSVGAASGGAGASYASATPYGSDIYGSGSGSYDSSYGSYRTPDYTPKKPTPTPPPSEKFIEPLPVHELRTWTSVEGRTLDAKFLSYGNGIAKLTKSDGSVVQVPMERFDAANQSYIKKIGLPHSPRAFSVAAN